MAVNFNRSRSLNDDQWAATLVENMDFGLPSVELQQSMTGSSGIEAFKEAAVFWRRIKESMADGGAPLTDKSAVLDFGVGWGRLYRWALRDLPPENIVGVDVDAAVVDLCKRAMPYGDFRHIQSMPPYDSLGDQTFDLIFLYSVFSHLSERSFLTVIRELVRRLKPNGMLAFTTLRLAHLDVWASKIEAPYFRDHLARAGFDHAAWRRQAANGDFLFVPTGGGADVLTPDLYGEAIATERYLNRVLPSAGARLASFSEPDDMPQALAIVRRE